MLNNSLELNGDGELAWTGANDCEQFLAYYCSFWNEEGVGGIAIHSFDTFGHHLRIVFLPIKKLDRRDPISDLANKIESWASGVPRFEFGSISILEFDVELAPGKQAKLVRNDGGDGVLTPRELRFDQTKSGRVTLDFGLTVRRSK